MYTTVVSFCSAWTEGKPPALPAGLQPLDFVQAAISEWERVAKRDGNDRDHSTLRVPGSQPRKLYLRLQNEYYIHNKRDRSKMLVTLDL